MRKDDPQINLRMPPELKARIQQEAKKNRRTQTAEIIARLQASFEPTMSQSTATTLLEGLQKAMQEAREMQEEARKHRQEAEDMLKEVRENHAT